MVLQMLDPWRIRRMPAARSLETLEKDISSPSSASPSSSSSSTWTIFFILLISAGFHILVMETKMCWLARRFADRKDWCNCNSRFVVGFKFFFVLRFHPQVPSFVLFYENFILDFLLMTTNGDGNGSVLVMAYVVLIGCYARAVPSECSLRVPCSAFWWS